MDLWIEAMGDSKVSNRINVHNTERDRSLKNEDKNFSSYSPSGFQIPQKNGELLFLKKTLGTLRTAMRVFLLVSLVTLLPWLNDGVYLAIVTLFGFFIHKTASGRKQAVGSCFTAKKINQGINVYKTKKQKKPLKVFLKCIWRGIKVTSVDDL